MNRLPLLLLALLAACGTEPGTDAGPGDAGESDGGDGEYAPAGFTLSPYLSDTPVRSFASAPAAGAGAEPGRDYQLVIETDAGRIVLDVLEQETPITTNSLVWLARHRFYDGVAFHRVIDGFMAQTGDPNTVGADRSTWGFGGAGYMFGLEIDPALRFDGPGVLGIARGTDPGTNSSQFFVTFAAASHLDGMYTIAGELTEGASVLALIARSPGPDYPPPAEPTRIVRAYAVERAAP